ncbi:hypothetical protein VaNZ11_007219 [Volvox africanus]|uniref:Uncharacterized protein n=1 Tax=Volvox africanus TaxID=51714 RepID=A0ABQ5S3P4_9CHLO|nr:hypothetical protein VaNZ11_007219 [Volvox africanus]
MPNAVMKTRTKQLQQGVVVEPVQLNSQLDALRREIARLEQQKLKQGTAKVAPGRPVSIGRAGARATQRGENPASSLMLAGTANRSSAAAQGPPVTKRARIPSAQAAGIAASAASGPEIRSSSRAVGGPSPPAASGLPAGLTMAPNAGALMQQNIGSKMSAGEVTGGLAAQHPPLQPKRQQARQKPQQSPCRLQPPNAGSEAAEVSRSQPAGQRTSDLSLQHVSQQEAVSSSQGGHHKNKSDNVVAGSGQHSTPVRLIDQQLQGTGAGAAAGMQQSPSQGGPGPPRKRPRTTGQDPAVLANAPEAAGCRQDSNSPGAGNANRHRQAAASGIAGILTTSGTNASALSGSPASWSKRVRPAVGITSTALRQDADGGGKGLMGPSDARLPEGSPSGHVQRTRDKDDARNGSVTDICPEAEQAATEFLMSFMTQIGDEGGYRSRTAVMTLQAQGQAKGNSDQGGKQGHTSLGISPEGPPVPLRSGSVVLDRPGNGCTEGRQLTGCERNPLVAGSGGGASARRAAAERTSAAVQRLRRKSSGVAAADISLRTATSLGMAAVGGVHVDIAANMVAAADGGAAGTIATPLAIPDGVSGFTAPLEAGDLRHLGRAGDAAVLPSLATTMPPSTKCQQGGAFIRSAQQNGDLLNAPTTNQQLDREANTMTSAAEGALAAATATVASVGGALAQEPAGVVSSPMVPSRRELGVDGVRSQACTGSMPPGQSASGIHPLAPTSYPLGRQAGAAVRMPSWSQLYSGGWGFPGDRSQLGPGHGATLGDVEPQQQLEQPQRSGVIPGSAPTNRPTDAFAELGMHGEPRTLVLQTSIPPSSTSPGTTASATVPLPIHAHPQTRTSVPPFRPGAPFGLLTMTAALQLPFMQPPVGMHPPGHAGGPFPSAFPPVPPPGAQWRSPLLGEVPLGGGQPAMSLVEMDVMVRKELILLRWHMLQELAAEIEAEWVEACHAHNRLRLLSMAQVAPTTATGAADSADVLGLQISTHQQPQDTSRACYLHSGAHGHPGLHSSRFQHQEYQHQHQQQQEQQALERPQQQQQQSNPGQAPNPPLAAAHMQPPVALPAAANENQTVIEQTESHPTSILNATEQAVLVPPPAARREEAPADAQEPFEPARPPSSQQSVGCQAQHSDKQIHAAALIQLPALVLEPGPRSEVSLGAEPSVCRGRGLVDARTCTASQSAPPVQVDLAKALLGFQQERAALEAAEEACAAGVPVCGPDARGKWQPSPNVGIPSARDHQHPGRISAALDTSTPDTAMAAGVGTSGGAAIVRVEAATLQVGVQCPGPGRPPAESSDAIATASEAAIRTQGHGRQHASQIRQRLDVPTTVYANVRQGDGIATVLTGSDPQAGPAVAVPTPAALLSAHASVAATRRPLQGRDEVVSATVVSRPPQPGSSDGDIEGTTSARSGVPSANTELGATIWTPWGDGSILAAPAGPDARPGAAHGDGCGTTKGLPATATQSGGGGGTSGNAAASGNLGDGRADDNRQTNRAVEAAAPFTGLSFKLSTAPLAGRRVATMRAQSGTITPAMPILVGERKRTPASVPVVVPASVVQPRSRTSAVVGGPSAASASAVAAVPLVTVSPATAEPLVRVQSASQVQSAMRARGGSPGNAVASSQPAQTQQESQATNNTNVGSAGVREVARPATNTASHVQAPRAAAPREEPALCNFGSTHQPAMCSSPSHIDQDAPQPSAQGCPAVRTTERQQQSTLPLLASPSAIPLYHGRRDIILRGGDAYGTASTSPLGMLTRKYMSPLRIFRSYSGGSLL